MCLIALPAMPSRFSAGMLANRDEQCARPSAPVDWWDDPAGILGGRDLQARAVAIHRDGRLAAMTDVQEQPPVCRPAQPW